MTAFFDSILEKINQLNLEEPIGILGFGVEGQSSYHFFKKRAASLVIFEKKDDTTFPKGAKVYCGDDYLNSLGEVKTIICSPGIRRDLPLLKKFAAEGGRVTSQVEIFFQCVPRDQIIGVTGTLGKGTCCSLMAHILDDANIPNILLGNIGVPFLDGLESISSKTKVILELSSFQLGSLRFSPFISVLLRTTVEHLDWHLSREEYWNSKANLVRHHRQQDLTVYFQDAPGSRWIASLSQALKVSVGRTGLVRIEEELMEYRDLKINMKELKWKGNFNLENIGAAAVVAMELGVTAKQISQAVKTFKGLEHRLEFVGEKRGIAFYNDSYATRPEATQGAIASFRGQSVGLILGGSEKNADFSELIDALKAASHLKIVVLIGDTRERLLKEIESKKLSGTELFVADSLEGAGERLLSKISKGIILLSPACASFGLFKNYKERGRAFKNWFEKIDSETHV